MTKAVQPKKPLTKSQALDFLDRYEQLNKKMDMLHAEMAALNTVIQDRREKIQQKELYKKILDLPN